MRRRFIRIALLALLANLVWSPVAGAARPSPAPAAPSTAGFPDTFLAASTSEVSPSDVWIVGDLAGESPSRAVFEHWDGASWSQVALPPLDRAVVKGILAFSADDALAYGEFDDALLMRWNGSVWTPVPSAVPDGVQLLAFDGDAPDDVWLTGLRYLESGSPVAVAFHWDGIRLKRVPVPRPKHGQGNTYYRLSVVGPHDVWVAGYLTGGAEHHPTIEHWDGVSWTRVQRLDSGYAFDGISATSATNVWASLGSATGPVIEHWDGTSWTITANPGDDQTILTQISAISADDAWAIGGVFTDTHHRKADPVSMHWDGTSWTEIAVDGGRSPRNVFSDLNAFAADEVWAVGSSGDGPHIRHWDGSTWS